MPSDFLSYWKPQTARRQLEKETPLMGHAASNQYSRLTEGDVVWIVSVLPGGRFILLGRIVVGMITDQASAEEYFGDSLWGADYHIIAEPGSEAPITVIDLGEIAADLRFESERDRLVVRDGIVDPKQLQTMRQLIPASAQLLQALWSADAALEDPFAPAEAHRGGAGFGDPETNRLVESAAVNRVRELLEAEGWLVRSVELDRVGYDLHCVRGEEELHAEVKGVRGPVPTFIITDGEFRCLVRDDQFLLYVVTDALGDAPEVHRYDAAEFLSAFALRSIAYKVMPLTGRDTPG